MMRELLTKSPLLYLPLGAFFVFFALFSIILFWMWKWPPKEHDALARLPLSVDAGGDK